MKNFYIHFIDNEARDTMIKYLPTCKKAREAEPCTHLDQMETLIQYTNMLPGTEPTFTDQQRKNLIFETFPIAWRQNYIQSGKSLQMDLLADIVQYMGNEKGFAGVDRKSPAERKRKSEETTKQGDA